MVAYQPPDSVLITVGATFRVEPLVEAARRLTPLVQEDERHLTPFGVGEEEIIQLRRLLNELSGLARDKKMLKADNPVQMTELPETLARIRGWLETFRLIGSLNLALDTPALERVASAAPELAEGYARDTLAELERRLHAAADLKPRLEEVGLDDDFLGRGRRLARQLATAIGKKDLDGESLPLAVRRFYHRKAQLYLLEKRICRAGRVAFALVPRRAAQYHLEEVEPVLPEPATRAVRPRPKPE